MGCRRSGHARIWSASGRGKPISRRKLRTQNGIEGFELIMADQNEPIHISTDRARGGATPHMTRYILGFSLVLVIIAFVLVYYLA